MTDIKTVGSNMEQILKEMSVKFDRLKGDGSNIKRADTRNI